MMIIGKNIQYRFIVLIKSTYWQDFTWTSESLLLPQCQTAVGGFLSN